MIRINLLPVKVTKKTVVMRQQAIIAGLALVLLMGILGVFEASLLRNIGEVQKKIAWTDSEISRLKQAKATYEDLVKAKKSVEEKLNTIDSLEKARSGPVHMLDELAMAIPMDRKATIPKKLWVSSMKQDGKKISLIGMALDNEVIASFMDRLEKSPYFTNIVLVGTQQELGKEIVLYKFSLQVTLETPAEGTMMTSPTTSPTTPKTGG